jgi:guanylate kinase
VLSGPSGAGKSTVVAELLRTHPEVWLSVSATTRAPRPGEQDGVHYFFIDEATFDAWVREDRMLEWAQFAGHRYGTPAGPVAERQRSGVPVLLEIELEGARQVRRADPAALLVFLTAPDEAELRRRLLDRGTETPEAAQRRLARAEAELAAQGEFDEVIVNDDVGRATATLVGLMGLSGGDTGDGN